SSIAQAEAPEARNPSVGTTRAVRARSGLVDRRSCLHRDGFTAAAHHTDGWRGSRPGSVYWNLAGSNAFSLSPWRVCGVFSRGSSVWPVSFSTVPGSRVRRLPPPGRLYGAGGGGLRPPHVSARSLRMAVGRRLEERRFELDHRLPALRPAPGRGCQ